MTTMPQSTQQQQHVTSIPDDTRQVNSGSGSGGTAMMIQMSDYTYELHDRLIATHPASPRGSSKLLRVNSQGEVSYYSNFSEAFPTLAKGCHIVFNDSRVLDARVFVKTTTNNTSSSSSSSSHANDEKLEMMILDMGNVNIKAPCNETNLTVMLRTDQVKEGDVFENVVDCVGKVKVVKING
jgi:S-adenosylmethionine:tRNA-ribosyltransferase-isomerase (queuine synthetase)